MINQKNNRVRISFHFTVIMLLVNGEFRVVIGGGAALQLLPQRLQNQENVKLLTMPNWTRKGGGIWNPELESLIMENPSHAMGKLENLAADKKIEDATASLKKGVDDENFSTAIYNPHNFQAETMTVKKLMEEAGRQTNEDVYEYEFRGFRTKEEECPEDTLWHARGQKCVPYVCPGGNGWRNRDTGDCILKNYGYQKRGRSRGGRPNNHRRRTYFGGRRGGIRVLLFG